MRRFARSARSSSSDFNPVPDMLPAEEHPYKNGDLILFEVAELRVSLS